MGDGTRLGGDDPLKFLAELMIWTRERLGLRQLPLPASLAMVEVVKALFPGPDPGVDGEAD